MKYAVITGTSRGLGASLAKLCIEQGMHVFGISRKMDSSLKKMTESLPGTYEHHACNLANAEQVEKVFSTIAEQLFKRKTAYVYLIHNAGVVNPIATSDKHTMEAINSHMHVNLIAPMITTSLFLNKAQKTDIPLIIATVTSGAADRSVYGWSAYSASKAGLNRFTESVALEQAQLKTKNKVILFDPSIMDTEMQSEIRSSSKEAFQDVEQFKQYKTENQLRNTDAVAEVLTSILFKPEQVINGKYYSVKDFL
ncbi:(S)-benzoin forming benzil reductase [Paraliobacillus sp. X-1268]|uniref:(S)-benzoin forming benzil reductase n=1 Tax=Paraliobacillus sp. X-1268 TaxID=2213193 RepID=UPI000E3BA847|nr:(S)-benzoin forming benzil reductase [Paraliobacillus sp. X-1268]